MYLFPFSTGLGFYLAGKQRRSVKKSRERIGPASKSENVSRCFLLDEIFLDRDRVFTEYLLRGTLKASRIRRTRALSSEKFPSGSNGEKIH
jgi:hypothetical protein